jgi:hypothetical protein
MMKLCINLGATCQTALLQGSFQWIAQQRSHSACSEVRSKPSRSPATTRTNTHMHVVKRALSSPGCVKEHSDAGSLSTFFPLDALLHMTACSHTTLMIAGSVGEDPSSSRTMSPALGRAIWLLCMVTWLEAISTVSASCDTSACVMSRLVVAQRYVV